MRAPTSPDGPHRNGRAHPPTPPPGPEAGPQAPDGGRDAHGRFAEGNPGGPGNPFARQVAALRRALLARITPQDVGDVADALLRQAREGNVAAARLLLSYALGRPAPAVDPDTLDQQEWELYRRTPDPAPEMLTVTKRLSLPVALACMRTVLPGMVEAHGAMLLGGLEEMAAADRAAAEARARRAARRERKKAQQAAAVAPEAPPSAEPRHSEPAPEAAADPEAFALLCQLLGTADTPARPGQAVTPPSTNGVAPHGRPWG